MKKIFLILATVILGASLPAMGKGAKTNFRQTVQAPVGDIRSLYLEFGTNMWCEWPTVQMGKTYEEAVEKILPNRRPALKVLRDDAVWQRVTDYAAAKGVNMVVLDLGEALIYRVIGACRRRQLEHEADAGGNQAAQCSGDGGRAQTELLPDA